LYLNGLARDNDPHCEQIGDCCRLVAKRASNRIPSILDLSFRSFDKMAGLCRMQFFVL